jgi:hypothetical protein
MLIALAMIGKNSQSVVKMLEITFAQSLKHCLESESSLTREVLSVMSFLVMSINNLALLAELKFFLRFPFCYLQILEYCKLCTLYQQFDHQSIDMRRFSLDGFLSVDKSLSSLGDFTYTLPVSSLGKVVAGQVTVLKFCALFLSSIFFSRFLYLL